MAEAGFICEQIWGQANNTLVTDTKVPPNGGLHWKKLVAQPKFFACPRFFRLSPFYFHGLKNPLETESDHAQGSC